MFLQHGRAGYRSLIDGIEMKTLAYGERTLMVELLLHGGYALPRHTHLHEQTGYLMSGHIHLSIGNDTHDVAPGDSWCIPGGVEHGGEFLEDSVAIEVFSPVREEYLLDDSGLGQKEG